MGVSGERKGVRESEGGKRGGRGGGGREEVGERKRVRTGRGGEEREKAERRPHLDPTSSVFGPAGGDGRGGGTRAPLTRNTCSYNTVTASEVQH